MSITSSPNLFVENYNLKWDSHLAYLNMSLASNLKNDRFADVMLISSHPESQGLPVIPAHKIILSSCSHFFSSILYNQSAGAGKQSIMYIVLPPELSYRAIKILIQYMYCGQSTVSKDIVTEVLRGGELLKIRGLCKNIHTNNTNNINNNQKQRTQNGNIESKSRFTNDSSKCHDRNLSPSAAAAISSSILNSSGLNHTQTSQDAARIAETLLLKESPVIIQHKRKQSLSVLPTSSSTSSSSSSSCTSSSAATTTSIVAQAPAVVAAPIQVSAAAISKNIENNNSGSIPFVVHDQHQTTTATSKCSIPLLGVVASSSNINSVAIPVIDKISIKKDIAIDPAAAVAAATVADLNHVPIALIQNSKSLKRSLPCNEVNCMKCSRTSSSSSCEPSSSALSTTTTTTTTTNAVQLKNVERVAEKREITLANGTIANVKIMSKNLNTNHSRLLKTSRKFGSTEIFLNNSVQENVEIPSLEIEYVPETEILKEIKSEPIDWLMQPSTASSSSNGGDNLLTDIKSENEDNDDRSDDDADDDEDLNNFTPLACELCNEKFILPKDWVRHIETHIDNNAYVPKKKRKMVAVTTPTITSPRTDVDYIAALKCDLCSTYYDSPADWVRHIQTAHTENELAFSNSMQDDSTTNSLKTKRSSREKKQRSAGYKKHLEEFLNTCETCGKIFPTASALRIHMRTHIENE